MKRQEIKVLKDLDKFRSSPTLSPMQYHNLHDELKPILRFSDWFTVGIMAPSKLIAIKLIRDIENSLSWPQMEIICQPKNEGPVFLKANQKTSHINIRTEYGLGEGIIITCHYNKEGIDARTIGPLPLDFFN